MAVTPVGTHCILELYDCSPDLLNDEDFIRQSVAAGAKEGRSALLGLVSHRFKPQGVTAVGLLAESHLSIHTWPEHGYAAIDIFTCGRDAAPRRACEFLARHFGAGRHSLRAVDRGAELSEHAPEPVREPSEEPDLCPART